MSLSDENLRGRTVIAADGQAIGKITSLRIDPAAWRVESICVELRKEIADRLGARRTMFHAGEIELSVQVVQSVGDAVVLSAGVSDLRDARDARDDGSKAAPDRPHPPS
jgi:sporulation protein YlmC with PRC-barrel domain